MAMQQQQMQDMEGMEPQQPMEMEQEAPVEEAQPE